MRLEILFVLKRFAPFFAALTEAKKSQPTPRTRSILAAYAWAASVLDGRNDEQQRAQEFIVEYRKWPTEEKQDWRFRKIRAVLGQYKERSADVERILNVLSLLEKNRDTDTERQLAELLNISKSGKAPRPRKQATSGR